MRRNIILLTALVLLLLPLSGCGKKAEPIPDLTGAWKTVGKTGLPDPESTDYYQVAEISETRIEVFWYTPRDDSLDLYWSGTFTPPRPDDHEPYTWESTNNPARTLTTRFALRDSKKDFIYKDGKLIYNVMMGHIKFAVELEKWDPEAARAEAEAR